MRRDPFVFCLLLFLGGTLPPVDPPNRGFHASKRAGRWCDAQCKPRAWPWSSPPTGWVGVSESRAKGTGEGRLGVFFPFFLLSWLGDVWGGGLEGSGGLRLGRFAGCLAFESRTLFCHKTRNTGLNRIRFRPCSSPREIHVHRFLAARLHGDRGVVLAAVGQDGCAIQRLGRSEGVTRDLWVFETATRFGGGGGALVVEKGG